MPRKINFHYYGRKSRQEWLELRKYFQGEGQPDVVRFGGSDVGKIMDLDRYTPPIVFFHKVCGLVPHTDNDNMEAYRGRCSEEHVASNYYPYFNPDFPGQEEFLQNVREGKVFRKVRKRQALVTNHDYPNLFANIDYELPSRYTRGHGVGITEFKVPRRRELEQHVDNLPRNHIVQLNTYLGIYRRTFGELFMLVDSTYPESVPFLFNESLFEKTLLRVEDFTERVLLVKGLIASGAPVDELDQAVAEVEPDVSDTPAYEEFLKDRYNPSKQKGSIEGGEEQLQWAIKYLEAHKMFKEGEKGKRANSNRLQNFMINNEVDTITFGGLGDVTWKPDSRGSLRFTVSKKIIKTVNENV